MSPDLKCSRDRGIHKTDHRQDSNGSQPPTKPWTNWNVLFMHSDLDNRPMPYRYRRILIHMQRRIGTRTEKNRDKNPGVDSIAKACRLRKVVVEEGLRWLEDNHLIEIKHGKGGRFNHYKVLVPKSQLHIDGRLDDAGYSAAVVCVLAHICTLSNDCGHFCINHQKFARICQMNRRTVADALATLAEAGLYEAYNDLKTPLYCLDLTAAFPPPKCAKGRTRSVQKGEPEIAKSVQKGERKWISERRVSIEEYPVRSSAPCGVFSDSSSEAISEKAIPRNWLGQTCQSDTEKEFLPHSSLNGFSPRCGPQAAEAYRRAAKLRQLSQAA